MAATSSKPKSNLAAFKNLKVIDEIAHALVIGFEVKIVRQGASELRYAGGHFVLTITVSDINNANGSPVNYTTFFQTDQALPILKAIPDAGQATLYGGGR